jgi:hypothetical protein
LDASKEIGLEVNSEKTKYMFMSRHQTAGQSNYIRVANKSSEKVAKFKYLAATLTDQNCIHEEIRSRLNSGNTCYRAVQNLFSSHLLSRNVKIKIHKTIILPEVLYGCKTLSLTLREEHRLRVFENRVCLGEYLDLRQMKCQVGENCIMGAAWFVLFAQY